MSFQLFHDLFPELAERETRTATVIRDWPMGLPPGEYGFLEMFCNEPGCDCRRVFFYVMSPSTGRAVEAVIAWGWETSGFYARWLKDDHPQMLADLKGPVLNRGSPRTALAPDLLELCRNVLLRDPAYVERIKRHYALFREKIDGKLRRKKSKSRKKRMSEKRKQ